MAGEKQLKTFNKNGWVCYFSDEYFDFLEWQLQEHKDMAPIVRDDMGKWLIFCRTYEYAEKLCSLAIEQCNMEAAKHSSDFSEKNGVCCFYIPSNDISSNMKFIAFFRDNDLLPKTKKGTYVNLAYKYDIETRLGLYGNHYKSSLHLNNYIDLETGKWTEFVHQFERKEAIRKQISKMLSEYNNGYYSFSSRLREGDVINTIYIKDEMKRQGKTIKDIANNLDVNKSTIRAWLKGNSKPLADNAMALCLYLGLNPSIAIIQN